MEVVQAAKGAVQAVGVSAVEVMATVLAVAVQVEKMRTAATVIVLKRRWWVITLQMM